MSPSCDFTCDWSKLNPWPTPWPHGLSTCGSLVLISHLIGRNWADRLSSASWITYWSAIAYRQVNIFFPSLSTCVWTVDTKNSIEFTSNYFPYHLKWILINFCWLVVYRITTAAYSFTKIEQRPTHALAVPVRKFSPVQGPIRFQDLFNSARSGVR